MQLREELERALEEINNDDEVGARLAEASPESFTDLVKDMVLNRQDIKAFAFKTKAMVTTIKFFNNILVHVLSLDFGLFILSV